MALYNLAIYIYALLIRAVSPFIPKAKLWVEGRRSLFENLQTAVSQCDSPIIWIHVASLGEFEQGRPVIELLRQRMPDRKIINVLLSIGL